ncbi:MAG: gluconate 2-dehydrogenase subunit 3 family protein [Bryobacteraceae bacterium]|nr:gluconate 2-dehydrogenase subunit 3 family protein [Bryobacteraceae bacterium]
MPLNGESRRSALKIIGAIGTTCAFPFGSDELYGQSEHAAHSLVQLKQAAPASPRYFAETDLKLISRLADLIIPDTDTPGAITAGVPAYIDSVVGSNQQHQGTFRKGLEWLRAKDFLSLTEEQQIALLTPLSIAADAHKPGSDADRFFAAMKNLTADGYFTSKIGLIQQLGYKGNAVVPDFQGCTHEH